MYQQHGRVIGTARPARRRHGMWAALLLLLVAAATRGTALAQGIIYAPGSVTLPGVFVGQTSNAVPLQFTVSGNAPVTVAAVVATTGDVPNGDFRITSQNCVGTLQTPANCLVFVTFTPSAPGLRLGAVLLTDPAGKPLVVVPVNGTGTGAQTVETPATSTLLSSAAPLVPAEYAPSAVTFDAAGAMFFNDTIGGRILRRGTDGTLSLMAAGVPSSAASSLLFTSTGTLLVSSPQNGAVYAVAGGTVTPLSYSPVQPAVPTGLAVDATGYLYTADSATGAILRSNVDGSSAARLPITGINPSLGFPASLALGADNALYAVDNSTARVIRIDLTSYAATVVSLSGEHLFQPYGFAFDAAGTLYIADSGDSRILVIASNGSPSTLPLNGAQPLIPTGIALDPGGNLAIADLGSGVLMGNRTAATASFPTPTPVFTTDTADPPANLVLVNIGNATAIFPPAAGVSNPSFGTASFAVAGGGCGAIAPNSPAGFQLNSGAACNYSVGFTPAAVGPIHDTMQVSAGTLGSPTPPALLSLALSGTGTPSAFTLGITASPAVVALGNTNALTITVGGSNAAAYRGTVTLTSTDPQAAFLAGTKYTFTAADAGSHTFTPAVRFSTTGTFTVTVTDGINTATSNPVTVNNPQFTSGITLGAAPNPLQVGASEVLSAQVTCTVGGGVATGTVQFLVNGALLGSTTLINNQASLATTAFTQTGNYTLTAVYPGDANCNMATSPAVTLAVVNQLPSQLSINIAPNPVLAGSTTVLTGTVRCSAAAPTGVVSFFDGGGSFPIGTAQLNGNAQAQFTYSTSTPGSHNITATYAGDSHCQASSAQASTLSVSALSFAATGSTQATVFPGKPASFSFSVAPNGTGTFIAPVTFSVTGAPAGSTVSFAPASLATGSSSTTVVLTVTPPLTARNVPAGRTSPFDRGVPAVLALLLLPMAAMRRRRHAFARLLVALFALAAASLTLTGCLTDKASGYFGQAPATSTLVVTATYGGTLTATSNVQLTVE